jgi:hypothetical protein
MGKGKGRGKKNGGGKAARKRREKDFFGQGFVHVFIMLKNPDNGKADTELPHFEMLPTGLYC